MTLVANTISSQLRTRAQRRSPSRSRCVSDVASEGIGLSCSFGGACPRPPGWSVQLEAPLIVLTKRRALPLLREIAVSGRKNLDVGSHEAAEGVLGRAHDRLAAHVEA